MAASTSFNTVVISAPDIRALARDLRAADPLAAKAASKRLKEAAEIVAAEARGRVDYSTRIPGSIKAAVTGTWRAKVKAGSASAPHAAAIENHGQGFVRHPVFVPMDELPGPPGRWTSRHSHPAFLAPAADARIDEVAAAVGRVLDDVMRDLGFGE
jgi:hypothetical protein